MINRVKSNFFNAAILYKYDIKISNTKLQIY
jgi:hypothetical protein